MAAFSVTRDVEITTLGAGGDGIAETSDGPLYVPFAAPGDLARVRPGERRGGGRAAVLVELLRAGPDRAVPACRHFGLCGGCALQHLTAPAYAAWLKQRVVAALGRRGIDAGVVSEPFVVPPGSRRRARFALRRRRGRLHFAFRAPRSTKLVTIEVCPVLRPAIAGALPGLAEALTPALYDAAPLDAAVTALDGGLDLLLIGKDPPSDAVRLGIPDAARSAGLVRVAWRSGGPPEPLVQHAPARLGVSEIPVELPPGAFLQPTLQGEAVLTRICRDALTGCDKVADLYAGCGPFAFALVSEGARVSAFESDAAMVATLNRAAGAAGIGGRVTGEARDLERRPLTRQELSGFDGAVLDPPRAGAAAQAETLAGSSVAAVVYASCNPASFARDARMLIDGGYRLEAVTPVGQFLWSAEVELIGVFRRS